MYAFSQVCHLLSPLSMTTEMSSSALLIPLLLLVFLSYGSTCRATDADPCSVSCGIHNISRPFRLKDDPEHCGDLKYNLSCEDNQLLLYWESGKYHVQSIDYNKYSIRLADANIPRHDYFSLPRYSSTAFNFSPRYATYQLSRYSYSEGFHYHALTLTSHMIIYWSCPYTDDSSDLYVDDTAACINSSYAPGTALYVNVVDDDISLSHLGMEDSCRIELMYMTSWPAANNRSNISCSDIHSMLLYGFELSWLISVCHGDSLDDNNKPYCETGFTIWAFFYSLARALPGVMILFSALKFVFGGPVVIILIIYKWRRRHLSMYDAIEVFLRSDNNIMPIRYSYKDIKRITGGFKIKLGKGGYGSVFKGKLKSGRLVAVKILDKAKEANNGQEFINEVATIGRIHHVNVVQLIGFCVEGSKRALIYEFMENGSLEKYIFSLEESCSLSCEKLHAISLGIARGIDYLHNGCDMKILHFDIKPHNILLDENFNPKVSDFGLARLYPTDNSIVSLTAARGTIGYMAPELFYRNVGSISYKADVYSFGMLLMEMASKRKNLNALAEHSSQIYFPFWVYDRLQDGEEITIANERDEEIELAKKMMIVALWCIQTRPSDRPSMNKVVEMLVEDEELEMPRKPYLCPQDLPAEDVRDHSSLRSSSDILVSDSKESI